MKDPLVALSGVCKSYGQHRILRSIDLRVDVGETVALLGPSGGGKSTLLRCINGLASFDAGEIRVGPHVLRPQADARAALRAAEPARAVVGMVFQDFQLFPHLTALENVSEAPIHVRGMPRREARAEAEMLLSRVGLGALTARYPSQLSGGQKQRVAIARALAMRPQALLCDEITSALDAEVKGEVLAVLESLRRDGLTLLLVTHEIAFARRAADRVAVLVDGTIAELGTPREVLDAPRHDRVQRFLSHVAN